MYKEVTILIILAFGVLFLTSKTQAAANGDVDCPPEDDCKCKDTLCIEGYVTI